MRLWSFIIVFAIAVGLGILIQQDPGYTLFAYKDWTVEMPLWLAVIVLFLGIVILMSLFFILNTVFSSRTGLRNFIRRHKANSARKKTVRGLLELAEGRYKKAERYLSAAAPYSEIPLINYLSAAKAAEEEGSLERSGHYLELAQSVSPGSNMAVQLTAAKLQFKHGDIDQSIATLQHLYAEKPKHPEVLKLLSSLYQTKQDWLSLLTLLPAMNRASIFKDKGEEFELEQKIYSHLFPLISEQGKDELIKLWRHAPRAITRDPFCQKIYAESLLRHGCESEVESLLRQWIQKNYQKDLIYVYGKIKGPLPKKQLAFAESLLAKGFNDYVLYLTLGRLAIRNQLWGRARDYLEQSLRLKESAEAYILLGQLMDKLNETKKRDECFKKGLFCVMDGQLEPLK